MLPLYPPFKMIWENWMCARETIQCLNSAEFSQGHVALLILALDKTVVSKAEATADVS